MGRHKGVLSERVVLQYFLRQFSGVPGGGLPEDEVRVDEPDIFLAEDAVVELQNLSSDELVISVDHHEDVVGFTKFHGCFFDVEESTSLVEVGLYFVPVLADFTLFLHEIFNNLCCTIRRSIVNNDDMEIRIVLHHNRTNVPESPLVFLVVEGRDDHAEG